jgi:hypothetical protein
MRVWRNCVVAAAVLTACPWAAARAGVGWSIGLNFGVPAHYYHPYWGFNYYYHPYPVYYVEPAPAAVVVQPAPVYQSVPAAAAVPPAYLAPTAAAPPSAPAAPAPSVAATSADGRQADIDRELQQLGSPDEHVRADAALQLGRLKAQRAVSPLTGVLASDHSPAVRDAAARALGLIDAPAALTALQHAAQADDDRDVRRSAQFAAEIIRANMPR